jgi:hypothetical protein
VVTMPDGRSGWTLANVAGKRAVVALLLLVEGQASHYARRRVGQTLSVGATEVPESCFCGSEWPPRGVAAPTSPRAAP